MANPIIRGFSKLTQFSGRDTRGDFWPYVGVVFALVFFGGGGLMATMMSRVFADMSAFAAAHPEAATVQSSPGHYSVRIDANHPEAPMPDFGFFFTGWSIILLIAVLLLAAAVTRRLHDRNMAGFWGLMPVPFLGIAMTVFPILMNSLNEQEPRFDLFGLLFLNNMAYLAGLVTLIVLLARRGTPGPNRYGPAPLTLEEVLLAEDRSRLR